MAWTYDLTTDRGKVRLMTGDTQTADQQLTDDEVDHFLSVTDDLYTAAADAIEQGIIPKLARDVDRSNIGMSSSRSQRMQHYMDLAKNLRAKAGTSGVGSYVGGISVSDRDDNASQTDVIQPIFDRDDNDNVGGL